MQQTIINITRTWQIWRTPTYISLNKNSNDMAKPFENGEFGKFGEYGENDEFDVERAPLIVVILTKMAHLAKILP